MRSLFLALCSFLFTFSAAASEGGHHAGPDWSGIGLAAVNFVMFVLLLFFLLKKPVKEFFSQRSEEIAKQIEEAGRLKQEAEAKYREYEEKLKVLEEETERILEEARDEGKREKERILEEARKSAEKIKRDAERMVDQEVRTAKQRLRKEAVEQAVEAAARILEEQFNKDDDTALVKATLKELETRGGSV